jgi:hypothetical protein
MNSGSYLFIIGLVVIAFGVAWILAGGPGADTGLPAPSSQAPQPTPGNPGPAQVQNIPVQQSSGATPSVTAVPVTIATPVPGTTAQVSLDDIKLHFMDLAFGSGNAYLQRWKTTGNNDRIVISVSANADSDLVLLADAAKEFNSISATTQMSEMIKQGMNGDIAIKFIPGNGMSAIILNTSESMTNHEFQSNGTTIAKITQGTIYIDADLRGDQRNHTLMRSLYYELGATGATTKYPDSLFYSGDNTNVNLTPVDRGAIGVMYGPGLSNGMTVDDIRKIVYIR